MEGTADHDGGFIAFVYDLAVVVMISKARQGSLQKDLFADGTSHVFSRRGTLRPSLHPHRETAEATGKAAIFRNDSLLLACPRHKNKGDPVIAIP